MLFPPGVYPSPVSLGPRFLLPHSFFSLLPVMLAPHVQGPLMAFCVVVVDTSSFSLYCLMCAKIAAFFVSDGGSINYKLETLLDYPSYVRKHTISCLL